MNSVALIVPVFLIMLLLALIIKLCVFLTDVVADMQERQLLPEPTRMMRQGLAIFLLGVLIVLGGVLVRTLFSIAW